jgi:D-beta-D-heptose 7-phosphate kinase/D-beta-D-heptose 1-phosphate adenosyltransferase
MDSSRIQQLIHRFDDQKILVVGDVMLDHYTHGSVERLNPEAPVALLHVDREEARSGGAGNVAKSAAALEVPTVLVSVVGEDSLGARIEEVAASERYMTRFLHTSGRQSIQKNRYFAGNQQLLRVDYERVQDLSRPEEDELLTMVEEELNEGVTGVIISDYAKGVVTARVAKQIIQLCTQKKLRVAADVKPERAYDIAGVTLISPNLREAHSFLKMEQISHDIPAIGMLASKLHKELATDVFITMGAQGMCVATGSGKGLHVPQEHVVDVFDVSGAGDTAIVLLLLSYLAGADAQEAARVANAGGAVVVGKVGSVGLRRRELLDMLVHRHQ